MSNTPIIEAFFDEPTNTVTYLVADSETGEAAVIDPVMDYDHNDGSVDARSAEEVLAAAQSKGWKIVWALETHAHADHLSAAPYIKGKTGARIGIGEHITDVQRIFRPVFNATDLKTDGSDFDHLFKDGETVRDRQSPGRSDARARAHASRHRLQDWRRRIRRRHHVHARLRHRARRLSRRRRTPALSLDPPHSLAARQHAPLHVPRLQGPRTGQV